MGEEKANTCQRQLQLGTHGNQRSRTTKEGDTEVLQLSESGPPRSELQEQEEEQQGQREAVEHHKCLERQGDRGAPEGPPRHTAPQSP